MCLLARCGRCLAHRSRSLPGIADSRLLTPEWYRECQGGYHDYGCLLASFHCRFVHMVPRVHKYEFTTSLTLVELRKIDVHRSRRSVLAISPVKGVRLRHNANIHVPPNSLLALPRRT